MRIVRSVAGGGFALAALIPFVSVRAESIRWDRDIGKPAPVLVASEWIGTPVSLDAVRGNTVVLAFWNADIPC